MKWKDGYRRVLAPPEQRETPSCLNDPKIHMRRGADGSLHEGRQQPRVEGIAQTDRELRFSRRGIEPAGIGDEKIERAQDLLQRRHQRAGPAAA